MELYKEYILEREAAHLFYNDFGFITWEYLSKSVHIIDIYIRPEYRKSGKGKELEKVVLDEAKTRGYKTIICSACTDTNNWHTSLEILKKVGYQEMLRESNMIWLFKELK